MIKMDALTVTCLNCESRYKISAEHAGKNAKCKNCSAVIRIPEVERLLQLPVDQPIAEAKKYCTNCGSLLESLARFCSNCGAATAGGFVDQKPSSVTGVSAGNKCIICGEENDLRDPTCRKCELPLNNKHSLEVLKRNLAALQERLRKEMPKFIVELLRPQEYVSAVTLAEQNARIYILTESRLMIFSLPKKEGVPGNLDLELKISEITAVSDLRSELAGLLSFVTLDMKHSCTVFTNQGEYVLWFQDDSTSSLLSLNLPMQEFFGAMQFINELKLTYSAFMLGNPPSQALLMRAEL